HPSSTTVYPLSLPDALPISGVGPHLSVIGHKLRRSMPIGDEIRSAGAALLAIDPAAHPEDIANQLNTYLNRFLPQRFRATTAHADRKSTRLNSSHEWTSYAV